MGGNRAVSAEGAAFRLCAALARGAVLSDEEAGRTLAGLMPGDWYQLRPFERDYFVQRALKTLETGSLWVQITDDVTADGHRWFWYDTKV